MHPNAEIEVIETKLFAGAVADELVASIGDVISERGSCSLVLSGGGTPASVYRALARPPRVEEVDWHNVKIFWGDERWVPQDHHLSNYRMAQETLLCHLPAGSVKVYPIDTSPATPEEGARQYARRLFDSGIPVSDGLPVFDIVLLGMGEDGHFASVYPGSELLSAQADICAPSKHPTQDIWRVTLLPRVLLSARRVFFIISGERKAEVVKRVLNQESEVEHLPARLYENASARVTWFLDSAASQRLPR